MGDPLLYKAPQSKEAGGAFATADDYSDFCIIRNKKAKKALDKAGIAKYNVDNISIYAGDSYEKLKYNEVYTEYRTQKLLERILLK
ncbi:MAG: hypothetical protein II714_03465 [Oscillospiraceae bacterium]|nr:hypothetical protein [Oscillospiraceae bacterium]